MDLYYSPTSPPCRVVLLLAKALGIEFNKIHINTMAGEHLKPEFVKVNPQHMIPTLVDNGFVLWESRAIMVYLVEKYGKTDALYPKDPKKQAVINQRFYFNMGTLEKSLKDYYYGQLKDQAPADPELYKKIEAAFEFFNTFLEGQKYAAGDSLTLADIDLVVTISTARVFDLNLEKYTNVVSWYESVQKEIAGFDEDWESCLEIKKYIDEKMKK